MSNFDKIKLLYSLGHLTNDEVFGYVTDTKITSADYKTIVNEDCPEIPLATVIANKIAELEADANTIKLQGFDSTCLDDTNHTITKHFDTDGDNIGYIQGLAAKASVIKAGGSFSDNTLDWKSSTDAVCYTWTPDEIIYLGGDLSTFLTGIIKKKELLQQYVGTLTDADTIASVNFDTIIPTTPTV